jgi:hypothetical protein
VPEPFGVIISVIKKRILLPFQANISLVTELYVMKWGITELQAVSMTLLSFQQPGNRFEDAINEHPAVAESAIVVSLDIKGMHYMALLF